MAELTWSGRLTSSSEAALAVAANLALARARTRRTGETIQMAPLIDTDGLLLGILMTHGDRSPLRQLLSHVGIAWTDLREVLTRGVEIEALEKGGPASVTQMTPEATSAMEVASRLADEYNAGEGLIRLRDLFGGVLETETADELLGAILDSSLEQIRRSYTQFLQGPADRDYGDFLRDVQPIQNAAQGDDTPSGATYQPEARVARDFWTIEDRLGYASYADAIAEFICHEETRPPLTIGIKAPWGAGKTSLMRMIQARLDPPVNLDAPRWTPQTLSFTTVARERLEAERGKGVFRKVISRIKSAGGSNKGVSIGCLLRRLGHAPEEAPDFSDTTACTLEDGAGPEWRPTIWFNPWMYQTGEAMWAGFAYEILQQVTSRLSFEDRERFWLELNLRRIDRDALRRRIYRIGLEKLGPALLVLVVGALLSLATLSISGPVAEILGGSGSIGGLLLALIAWRGFRTQAADQVFSDLFQPPGLEGLRSTVQELAEGAYDEIAPAPDYRSSVGFLYLVHADVRQVLELIATPDRPVVIFVDDLDRCSPGVVAQTIEAINLFLAGEFPNCVFVLAIEPSVVAAHIEVAHAKLVDRLQADRWRSDRAALGWRFLEKIVQLPLSLPRPGPRGAAEYLESLLGTASRAGERRGDAPDEKAVRTAVEDAIKQEAERLKGKRLSLDQLPQELEDLEGKDEFADMPIEVVRDRVLAEVFSSFYRDSDPTIQSILGEEIRHLPDATPREVKRLLNLFRFYAFVAARSRLLRADSSETQRSTLEKVAHLAGFILRWPQLLNLVSTPAPELAEPRKGEHQDERPPNRLEQLEAAAEDYEEWAAALEASGLISTSGEETGVPALADDLRAFLREGPEIGRFSRSFL